MTRKVQISSHLPKNEAGFPLSGSEAHLAAADRDQGDETQRLQAGCASRGQDARFGSGWSERAAGAVGLSRWRVRVCGAERGGLSLTYQQNPGRAAPELHIQTRRSITD